MLGGKADVGDFRGFGVLNFEFGVWCLGFGIWGLAFWSWGLGFGVWASNFVFNECGVKGLGYMV